MSSESENIMVLQKKIKVISLNMKGGPGATVEPTVCNQKVPGSRLGLHTLCWKGLVLKTTLPQTPRCYGRG